MSRNEGQQEKATNQNVAEYVQKMFFQVWRIQELEILKDRSLNFFNLAAAEE